jgi:hypothetical protein
VSPKRPGSTDVQFILSSNLNDLGQLLVKGTDNKAHNPASGYFVLTGGCGPTGCRNASLPTPQESDDGRGDLVLKGAHEVAAAVSTFSDLILRTEVDPVLQKNLRGRDDGKGTAVLHNRDDL